jgi:Uma2 family endonuclease
MAQTRLPVLERSGRPQLRYVRAPRVLHFPEQALMPEGTRHLVLRTFLWRLLRFCLGPEHTVGSDQFVYWNASDSRRTLAPDVFVKLGVPARPFGSWKTWERGGAPELAVEIVSPTEDETIAWDDKLARYHELGIGELVRFDPEAPEGKRIRIWDRVDHDLVEREVTGDRAPCLTLGVWWEVHPVEEEHVGLRLVDDAGRLLEAPEEEAAARAEREAQARAAAEARIRDLEEEVRRRGR